MKVIPSLLLLLLLAVYVKAQSPGKYLLVKPGNDYANPLSKITLTITVK
jgi:hypothetical protein